MKHLLIFILLLSALITTAQTSRIRNLSNEATYNGTLCVPVDKSTYSVHHKLYLSVLTNYIDGLSATRDTAIWNRLTVLEGDTLWEAGTGTQSIQAIASSSTASGDYGLAHGYQSWANFQGSRGYSSGSGKAVAVDGWAECLEFTAYGNTGTGAGDTLLIGTTDNIDIPNNYATYTTVKILGVGYSGSDKAKTYGGEFAFMIKQDGGTTSISAVDTLAFNLEAGCTAVFVPLADDTNERLVLSVTGTDGGNMYWKAEVKMILIKFD